MIVRSIHDLHPHPDAEKVPLPDADTYDAMVADIAERGIVVPLDITDDGTILDGRTRYRIARNLGLAELPVRVVDPSDQFEYMVKAAIERRHLSPSQRAMLALALDEYQQAKAEAAERQGERTDLRPLGNVAQRSVDRPRDVAAKKVGVSGRLVADAEKVKTARPDLAEQVSAGKVTVSQAARQIRRDEDRARAAAAPVISEHADGQRYRTIVIDPPWDASDEGDVDQMGRAQPLYATMPIEQVRAMPIPDLADPDGCHLYLWITNRSLPKGFGLLEAWGFRYITTLTWVKPSIGVGNYFRNNTEHILFGVKGKQPLLAQDVGTWMEAPRGSRHSAKPDAWYALIARCSAGPRLDIFGRGDRDGFAVWGSEMAA